MNPGYNLWYMHGETMSGSAVCGQRSSLTVAQISLPVALNRVNSQNREGALEHDDHMHAMLRDAFGMHDVAEAVSMDPQQVDEGTFCGDALKYQELLKTAEKPLYPGTRHSKLSATVHMYNLKCIGGISNKKNFRHSRVYQSAVASLR
jgi:hypothetical protein